MTRSLSPFFNSSTRLNLILLGFGLIGRSSVVNDLCYWSAHNICRMWSGALLVLPSLSKADVFLVLKQTYTDLRQLRVANVVQAILKD